MSSVRFHDTDAQGMVTAALVHDRPAATYALLADGTTVEIRPATPGDFDAAKEMYAAMSPDNSYLRFFNFSQLSAEREADRMCREAKPGRMALLALADGQVAGCGSYDEEPGGKAEVAFAVAERLHHQGIATLLLEHLVLAARSHGITNATRVLAHLGLGEALAQVSTEPTRMIHRDGRDGRDGQCRRRGHRYMGLEVLAACRKAGQPAKDNESPETAVAIDAIVA
jgi:GNAT superfamily N-acetyltransferase